MTPFPGASLLLTDNTSGNPPRDATKMIRTTIHRVSVGVFRIKFWHLVSCFVWVPSKTLKGFHVVHSTVFLIDAELTAAKQPPRRSLKCAHRCCDCDRLPDERSTKSPRLFIRKVQYLTFTHRIRIEATARIPGIQGTGCVVHSCLRGPIRVSAPSDERGGHHGCVHQRWSCGHAVRKITPAEEGRFQA